MLASADLAGKMSRGSLTVAVQRVVEALIGLFLVPFTLYHLGREAYGLWALFYSVVVYLNLADMGFSAALTHHFVRADTSKAKLEKLALYSSSLVYLLTIGALVLIIGLVSEGPLLRAYPEAAAFSITAIWVWRAMLVVLVLGFVGSYARALFYATQRVAQLAFLGTGLSILNALLVVYVLLAGYGLTGLAAAAVTLAVLRLLLVFSVGVRGVEGWGFRLKAVNRDTIRQIWSFGLRVFVARIAETIYFNFDRLLLGRVLGLGAVASYDIGAKAAMTANQLPLTLLPTIEPAAAALYMEKKLDALAGMVARTSRYMAILAFGLIGYLLVLSGPLITLWLGRLQDPQVILTLQIIAIAYLFASTTGPLRASSRGVGFPGWEAKSSSLQALANILLSITLFFLMGFIGVLIGTVIATVAGHLYFMTLSLRGLPVPGWPMIRDSYLKPVAAALVATIATWLLAQGIPGVDAPTRPEVILPIFAGTLLFTTIYLGALALLKSLTWGEIRELWGIVTRRGGE